MEAKLKINELNRPLFPELALSLEKYGQLQPILIDENGYVHDGQKRVLLCGLEQLTKTIVPINAPCSNESDLKRSTKQILIKSLWETANKSYGLKCAKKLAERYGVSERTINRWVNPEITTNVAIQTDRKLQLDDYAKDIQKLIAITCDLKKEFPDRIGMIELPTTEHLKEILEWTLSPTENYELIFFIVPKELEECKQ